MHSWTKMFPLVAMFLIVASMLSGCSPSQDYGEAEPRAVTEEEAERMSVMRFNNYNDPLTNISVSLTDASTSMWLEGRVDFTEHVGYGNLLMSGETDTFALVQWTMESASAVGTTSQQLPAQPPGEAPWEERALDPSSSNLDMTLALVLEAASDRPENPLLLRQNGAQWLGKEEITDTEVDVFSAPGEDSIASDSLLYYVDDEANLRRLVVNFPGTDAMATINFLDGDAEEIEPAPTNES